MTGLAPLLTEQEISFLVFGRIPTDEDWTHDIASRLPLIFSGLDAKQVMAFEQIRIGKVVPAAISALEQSLARREGQPEILLHETTLIRDTIGRLAGAALDPSSRGVLGEALLDDLDGLSAELIDEGYELAKEAKSDPAITQALEVTREALAQPSGERGTLLRDARRLLFDAIENGSDTPVAWLLLGWIVWTVSEQAAEAVPMLKRAAAGRSLASHLANCLSAHFASLDGDYLTALNLTERALATRPNCAAHKQAAMYGFALKKPALGLPHLEKVLADRPTSFVSLLGIPACASCREDMIDCAVTSQTQMRNDAKILVGGWKKAVEKVVEAQSLGDVNLQLSFELIEGHKQIGTLIATGDIVSISHLVRRCAESRTEVTERGLSGLKRELQKKVEGVANAKRGVESAWTAREARVEAAKKDHERAVNEARQSVQQLDADSDKAQKGCFYGLGSGCGVFCLYIAASFILGMRGIEIGMGSPVGLFAIAVACLPIAASALVQVATGLKRVGFEAQVKAMSADADAIYEQSTKVADDFYREQVANQKSILEAAELEFEKVSSALRFMETATN